VQRGQHRRRRLAILAVFVAHVASFSSGAFGDSLVDKLATDDPAALADAVTAIERAPANADALFAAGRACEDRLVDPARALAIYDRIQRELPDTSVAASARRRAERLRQMIGGGHAAEAADLARLVANADRLPPDDIVARASALATADWPGAADAGLWIAEWLRRSGRYAEAQPRYADVVARWPHSPQAATALRGGAGNAIDQHAWDLAESLVERLPAATADERIVRDELADDIARGRRHERWYVGAWLALAATIAALLASLVEVTLRSGRPALRPPVEVVYFTPIAVVLVAVSFTAHRAIAPAVTLICAGGLVFAWLSGATLDRLRVVGRPLRVRALGHIAMCALGVAALGYIALTRDGLVELLVDTVQFGPQS
jgi:hypothetical protein